MQSSKQVKDLQINLKSIRLDFFWKNKNVCMFAGLVGVRGAGKQRAGSFFSPPFQTSTMQARNEHVKVNLEDYEICLVWNIKCHVEAYFCLL